MSTRVLISLFLFLLFAPAIAHADIYSWADRSGNQFFSDSLANIPEEYRDQARKVDHSRDLVSVETRTIETLPAEDVNPVQTAVQNGRDEQWWREQARNLHGQIAKEEVNLGYYNERRRACEEQPNLSYRRDCANAHEGNIKRAEWNIEKLKVQLEELSEQARKAGAMPGWLRK